MFKNKPRLFLLLFLVGVLILAIVSSKSIFENWTTIAHADVKGNDIISFAASTTGNGTWTIDSGQKSCTYKISNTSKKRLPFNSPLESTCVDYSGYTCRDVCDNMNDCAGFLLDTNRKICTFKKNVSTQLQNQSNDYFLNVK